MQERIVQPMLGSPKLAERSVKKLGNGLSIFRLLDEVQTTEIMETLATYSDQIPGMRIRGESRELPPPALVIISRHDTREIEPLRSKSAEFAVRSLTKSIPLLRKELRVNVAKVEMFAGLRQKTISLSATFDAVSSHKLKVERGQAQAVLSEINGWTPIILDTVRPRVPFVTLPVDTDTELISDLKHEIHEVIAGGLTLGSATIHS